MKRAITGLGGLGLLILALAGGGCAGAPCHGGCGDVVIIPVPDPYPVPYPVPCPVPDPGPVVVQAPAPPPRRQPVQQAPEQPTTRTKGGIMDRDAADRVVARRDPVAATTTSSKPVERPRTPRRR